MSKLNLQADTPDPTLTDMILEIIGYAAPSGRPFTEYEAIAFFTAIGHADSTVRGEIGALIEADHLSLCGHGAHRWLRLGDTPVDDIRADEDPWLCAMIVSYLASDGGWMESQTLVDEIVAESNQDEEVVFDTVLAMLKVGRLLAADPFDLLDENSALCLNTLEPGVSTPADMDRYGPLAWSRDTDGRREICHHLFAYDADDHAVTGMPIEPITPFTTRGGRVGQGWPEGPIYNDQAICLLGEFGADDRLVAFWISVGPNAANMTD
ncbi:MAG: hypothetical protein KGJ57_18600 [Sphingomonadales bacterium]|nr:hypothetical protein [Sphingomonadales bacterium]